MAILLYIALGYLLITSGVLYLNRQDFTPLLPIPRNYFDEQAPEVSICIPARNEADSIERCVRSAIDQQYPNHHVYVLDDQSTDGTSKILAKLTDKFPDKLTIIPGNPKPSDGIGKSWACYQLSEKAIGDILIFADADTWLEPKTTARVVRTMGRDVVDFITVWPEQKFGGFWEKTVIPLVYFALLTLLPVRYVHRTPEWTPTFLKGEIKSFFAAACGQFMAFKQEAYQSTGGHASVKNEVVEDVELAKNIKRAGYTMKMYHGQKSVSCRMYSSAKELWAGFRKNFLAGFRNNIFLFMGMGFLHLITFILPALAFPFLLIFGNIKLITLSFAAIMLMLIQRFIIDGWFHWKFLYGLLHPVGVGWFQMLGLQVLSDYLSDESVRWKDRSL